MNIWIQDIFSDENLEAAYENNINVLIMPRIIARRVNDKLRGKKFDDINYILEEDIKKVNQKTCEHYIKRIHMSLWCTL